LAYRIDYSPDAEDHLRGLTAREQRTVLDAVDTQLAYQPTTETRNRKLMRPNPLANWELRIGDLRVYYDVQDAPEAIVYVRAIGAKLRNQVKFGKEIVEL
jgi:mRNA-degrading endonuclease RelE of RelBE toxin-antitoxin system